MHTIAVVNMKGGCGKTTTALAIAGGLRQLGIRTLVADLDPQGSASQWAARAGEAGKDGVPVVRMTASALRRDLASVSAGFGAVVIDTPPRLSVEARVAMLVADLVIVPIVPGPLDVWASHETLAVLEEARALRPELRAVVLLNRTNKTALAAVAARALRDLAIEVLDTSLAQRTAHGEAMLAGMVAVDYAPASDAAHETRRLAREIVGRAA